MSFIKNVRRIAAAQSEVSAIAPVYENSFSRRLIAYQHLSLCGYAALTAVAAVLMFQAETGVSLAESGETPMTAYPNFKNVCSAFVVGYRNVGGPQLFPKLGNFAGACREDSQPIVFSVTQENGGNNHAGSANFDPNIVAYMGDVNVAKDLDRWIGAAFRQDAGGEVLALSLDTINYRQINVTGWPLQFGHLFLGANDRSVKGTLDAEIAVDADLRIIKELVRPDLYPGTYSGHRVLIGVRMDWTEESPRTNKVHYLEVDLAQSAGYAASYGDPRRPLCRDARYDRCFYSDDGRHAEGREIDYATFLNNETVPVNANRWIHVHIPLSQIYRKVGWVSPPKSWRAAALGGLYIGLESEGAAQEAIEVRNYRIYSAN